MTNRLSVSPFRSCRVASGATRMRVARAHVDIVSLDSDRRLVANEHVDFLLAVRVAMFLAGPVGFAVEHAHAESLGVERIPKEVQRVADRFCVP